MNEVNAQSDGLYNLSLLFYKSIKFKIINQKEQKERIKVILCIET